MFELPCGVRLRQFQSSPPQNSMSDIDHILSIYNNTAMVPLVTQRFMVPRGDKLKDEFKKAIEDDAEMFCVVESMPKRPASGDNAAPLWDHDTPRFIGFVALWAQSERAHRHSSFSIVIMPEAQGRGIGTALTRFMIDHAFIHLNMHRISLSAFEGNDRALAVYRKCGFIDEGRMRKAYWVAGQWKDYINMGILIDDWKNMQNSAA